MRALLRPRPGLARAGPRGLRRGQRLEFATVATLEEAIAALRADALDAVVADPPYVEGARHLSIVRQRWGAVPFVLFLSPGRGMADPILLRHVYQNLLANALKFTRPREVATIECDAEAGADGTRYFVRKNVVGFDKADADRLLEPFARLHAAHVFEGSGTGLALVNLIVERHGGRAWAEGEVDHGAMF